MQTLAEKFKVFALIKPQVATSTVTGSNVNVSPDDNQECLALLEVGAAATDATDTCAVTVQGSADGGSTYTTVATFVTVLGTLASAGGRAAISFQRGLYTSFRAVATIVSGNSASFPIAVQLLVAQSQQSGSVNSATVS